MVQDLVHNLCESLVENIGGVVGIGKNTPPPPVTYLTQWKLIGNSEVHGQEIWSCGEYSAVDGKYHILVQPLGGSIADIALTEPLRKVNDVTDKIEFVNGVATLTRNLKSIDIGNITWSALQIGSSSDYRMMASVIDAKSVEATNKTPNMLTVAYTTITVDRIYTKQTGISINTAHVVQVYDPDYNQSNSASAFKTAMAGVELIYELATPTRETIQVPQIAEADSYACVISQGGKAVSWSDFETN